MPSRILLVEDEPGLVLTVSDLLTEAGYEVESAMDGEEGLALASRADFDMAILDVMLPKKSGFEVCRQLREQGADFAVLMLTAKSELQDRVTGLNLGADDYLVKPFEPLELLARVEAMLRRVGKERRMAVTSFRFGDVAVDFERAELLKGGQPVMLAGKEFQLLRYLIDNRRRVVPREELLQKVWEYSEDVASRTLDVHIAWLRQKLEEHPQSPRYIHTVRGKGYRFSP
jgi:two-component system alkaline phosphatase synthesis response regulator PhoP